MNIEDQVQSFESSYRNFEPFQHQVGLIETGRYLVSDALFWKHPQLILSARSGWALNAPY